MAKHTVKGALYAFVSQYSDTPSYHFSDHKLTAPFMHVVDHSFDIEIPDDFDPVAGEINALNEQKRQLRLKLAQELAVIDERISKLSAITYEPA